MKKHEITIQKQEFSAENASDLILTLINNQITNFNRIKFMEWEKNNLQNHQSLDETVNYLQHTKADLKNTINALKNNYEKVSCSISIQIAIDPS